MLCGSAADLAAAGMAASALAMRAAIMLPDIGLDIGFAIALYIIARKTCFNRAARVSPERA
jgi:hypothetical protein